MIPIKFSKEVIEFLKFNGTQVFDGETNWYYMPFWFKQIDKGLMEIYQFDDLPTYVKDIIKDLREPENDEL
jgi:hypothetical protein